MNKTKKILWAGCLALLALGACKKETLTTYAVLQKTDLLLLAGDTASLCVNMYGQEHSQAELRFESENPAVATVSETGLVTAVAVGETRVNVYSAAGDESFLGSCDVNVTANRISENGVTRPIRSAGLYSGDRKYLAVSASEYYSDDFREYYTLGVKVHQENLGITLALDEEDPKYPDKSDGNFWTVSYLSPNPESSLWGYGKTDAQDDDDVVSGSMTLSYEDGKYTLTASIEFMDEDDNTFLVTVYYQGLPEYYYDY